MFLASFSTYPEHSVHGNSFTPFSIMLLTGSTYPVANRLTKNEFLVELDLWAKQFLIKSLPVSKWCGTFIILWLFVVTNVLSRTPGLLQGNGFYHEGDAALYFGIRSKKSYRRIAFESLLSKELCVFCFVEVIQLFWLVVLVVFVAVD